MRVAEIGFALLAISGALQATVPVTRIGRHAGLAAGASLFAGAVVILGAIRWGSYGSVF